MPEYMDGYWGLDVGPPDRPMPDLPDEGKNYELEFRDGEVIKGRCESVFNQSLVFTNFGTGKRFACYLADFMTIKEI